VILAFLCATCEVRQKARNISAVVFPGVGWFSRPGLTGGWVHSGFELAVDGTVNVGFDNEVDVVQDGVGKQDQGEGDRSPSSPSLLYSCFPHHSSKLPT
jgi:hypothetical protein